jgi:hypothetical protein
MSGCAGAPWLFTTLEGHGGSCAAPAQVPYVEPWTWTASSLGCAPAVSPTSCGAGGICTASPPIGFGVCVFEAGDVACPAGAYATKHLVHSGVADTRDCTACACGAPTVACSGGGIYVFPNAGCNFSLSAASVQEGTCSFDGFGVAQVSNIMTTTMPVASGVCAPSGGQPTGTAAPTGAITVCCQ